MKALANMTVPEIEGYAKAHRIELPDGTKQEKLAAIEEANGHTGPLNVTVWGIDVTLPGDVLDDVETLDLMSAVGDGNFLKLPRLEKRMFGDDWTRIHEAISDDNGRVKASDAALFFTEVLTASKGELEAKN